MENKTIEKEVQADSWYEQYDQPKENTGEQLPIFEMKLRGNELARTEKIIFLSEGKKMVTRFGETIIFNINHDNLDKVWFIKKTQYNLLNPIAKQRKSSSLIGREAEVQRVGTGQKETKWSITFK